MAVFKANKDQMPAGAIRLTESEALELQKSFVRRWKPQREMFPIVYGHYFLAGAGLLSGVTINESLRRVFSLRVPVGVALAFPLSASVTVSLYALQSQFVTNDILLLKTPCQPCLLGRSALMQVMFGIAFPTVISAVGCGLFAIRWDTMYIPPINKEPANFFKTCFEIAKKRSTLIGRLSVLQVVVSGLAVFLQHESLLKLQEPLEHES